MPPFMNHRSRFPPTRELLWWLALVISVVSILTVCTLLNMPV